MSWQIKKRVQVLESNKHFFEYDGKPVWLSGHSRIWTLTSFLKPSYEPVDRLANPDVNVASRKRTYIDETERVAESGGHLMRITPFWPGHWAEGIALPWKQVEPGKFDLREFDEKYFADFREFLGKAAENDIIVQMELWDRPGLSHWHATRWPRHPFNPVFNVNYGANVLPDHTGPAVKNVVFGKKLFYRSVHGENPQLLEYQQIYIDKLLDECAPFPNVIYCIENEGTGGARWETFWANRIRSRIPDALITAMPLNPSDNTWKSYFEPPFSCLDGGGTGLRIATHGASQSHESLDDGARSRTDMLTQISHVLELYYLYMQYNPQKTMPIYVSNSFGALRDNIWAMFCCGAAGHRYHRNCYDPAETCYRWVSVFNKFLTETQVPFWTMEPRRDLLRGHGMCLANDRVAVVYIPNSKAVSFAPEKHDTVLKLRFMDADTGAWLGEEEKPIVRFEDGIADFVEIHGKNETGTVVYCQRQ